MKLVIFFLIAVPVLICTKSVQAGYNFIGSNDNPDNQRHKHHHSQSHVEPDTYDALNRNSIYDNNDQVVVRRHRSHKVYKNIEKDTTSVVVKDANGNVQESTQIFIKNRKDLI